MVQDSMSGLTDGFAAMEIMAVTGLGARQDGLAQLTVIDRILPPPTPSFTFHTSATRKGNGHDLGEEQSVS